MKHIIFIDADELMREMFARTLSKRQYTVATFASPVDALDEILANPPDLVISDESLPNMSGLELLSALRERGVDVPAIIITANPSDALAESARTLGVNYIFEKPFDELDDVWNAIRSEAFRDDVSETVRGLDELRLELLTDLSHQLRTPLTAMQLAMDGLFSQIRNSLRPEQQELAHITRRNITRIVTLVENQLELLQMAMGEMSVSRRLVDVGGLLDEVSARLSADDPAGDFVYNGRGDDPCYIFTDPDVLRSMANCLLFGGAPNTRRVLSIDRDDDGAGCRITVELHSMMLQAESAPRHEVPATRDGVLELGTSPTGLDFEHRAFSKMVRELGGDVTITRGDTDKCVEIWLPVFAAYDRNKDFHNPVRTLSRSANREGVKVSVIKCEFERNGCRDQNGLDRNTADLIERCRSVLSCGDVLLRGRYPGSFYLALVDRSQHELDHARDYLGECPIGAPDGDPVHVSRPQTLIDDSQEIGRLIDAVERG